MSEPADAVAEVAIPSTFAGVLRLILFEGVLYVIEGAVGRQWSWLLVQLELFML